MRSNALLVLAVCLFAAFAAAWTKEGTYQPHYWTAVTTAMGNPSTHVVAMHNPHTRIEL